MTLLRARFRTNEQVIRIFSMYPESADARRRFTVTGFVRLTTSFGPIALVIACVMVAMVVSSRAAAQSDTVLTYQGQLAEGGNPASGTFDMSFGLWNASTGGTQVGSTNTLNGVPVVEGLFTVQLDFGANALDNSDRWLEISVNGTALSPRQPITRAPYAIQTRGIFVDQANKVGIGTTTPQARLDVAGGAALADALSVNHSAPTEMVDVNGNILSRGRLLAGFPDYFFWVDPAQSFVGIGRNQKVTSSEIFGLGKNTTAFSGMYVQTAATGRPFYGYSAGGDVDAYSYFDGISNEWRLWHDGTRLAIGKNAAGTPLVSVFADDFEVESTGDYLLRAGKINGARFFHAKADNFWTSRIRWTGNQTMELYGNIKHYGDLEVLGTLTKGSGSFRIDHPLDPENRYLTHSFVESPDMMNIYNGNVVTDDDGFATVLLPEYFDALNRDFRYQLTVIGTFAQAIVSEKIHGNQFVIQTDRPNVEVSWQVTGIRDDAYARMNPIVVEKDKAEQDRGSYLHPEAFGRNHDREQVGDDARVRNGPRNP